MTLFVSKLFLWRLVNAVFVYQEKSSFHAMFTHVVGEKKNIVILFGVMVKSETTKHEA